MAEEVINSFDDADSLRIIRAVRKSEGLPVPPNGRRPTLGLDNFLIRVKTLGACGASNSSTGTMSNCSCQVQKVDPSSGACSSAGYNITVWSGGGAVASGVYADVCLNQHGMYQFVVVRC